MRQLRKGTANINAAAKSGGGYSRYINFKPGDVKYLAFVTDAEEIPQVRIHNFVEIPADNDKGVRYATFMCRKDPAWREESGNTCPLCDDIGHKALERFVALAVELEPTQKDGRKITKFDIVEREGSDGNNYPQVGLVIQSSKLFFSQLAALNEREPIVETVYEIEKIGKGRDTKYMFFSWTGTRPDVSSAVADMPSLDEMLEAIGTEEYYAENLEGVEPGSQKDWGATDNASSESSSSSSTNGSGSSESSGGRSRFDALKEAVGAE